MVQRIKHGALLAALLTTFFLVGNDQPPASHTVSVFPWLISLLVFPLVLFPVVHAEYRRRQHVSIVAVLQGAEVSVRWAAGFFCVATTTYTVLTFDTLPLILTISAGTFIATWGMGVVVSALCTVLVLHLSPLVA